MIVRACLLALLLMGVQGALNSQSSLFGKKVSSLGAGVVEFYPDAAIMETLKVAAAAALVFVFWGAWLVCAPRVWRRTSGKSRIKDSLKDSIIIASVPPPAWERRSAIALALLSYGLLVLAGALEYPALYESAIPTSFSAFIFKLSFVTSPLALRMIAFVMMLSPLLPRRRSRIVWPDAAACVAIVALLAMVFCVEFREFPSVSQKRNASVRPTSPHVIWIAVDSLRLDRLDRAGFLPAMQAFRDDPFTVSFRRHHVGVPRTFPSWIEMIQGKYAAETGVRHMFPGFPVRDREFDGIVSLAKSSGYRTMAVSDFAGDIFPRFSTGFEVIKAPTMALGTLIRQNIDQMFPLYTPLVTSPGLRRFFTSLKASPAYAAPRHLEPLVAEVLDDAAADYGEKPLFLTLFYSTAHFPYSAPWPYYRSFSKPSYGGPFWFQKNPSLTSDDQNIDDGQKDQVRALYDGALKSVDDSFGSVMAMLRSRGIWDDAIVVLTADHGEDLFESGILQGHGDHLRGDQTLRVPLLIKWPASAGLPEERQISAVSRSIDLAPTMAGLAGLKGFPDAKHDLQGMDLSPLVTGAAHTSILRHLPAYSETEIWFSRTGSVFFQKNRLDYPGISQLLTFDPGHSGEVILDPKYEKMLVVSKHRSLTSGQWKLIYMPTREGVRYELYDDVADSANAHDLSALRPEALAAMKSKFFAGVKKIESRARIIDDYIVPEGI